jgi:hypothetical protein
MAPAGERHCVAFVAAQPNPDHFMQPDLLQGL